MVLRVAVLDDLVGTAPLLSLTLRIARPARVPIGDSLAPGIELRAVTVIAARQGGPA